MLRNVPWRNWDLSAYGSARVVLITLVGIFGMMAVALLAVSYTTQFMDATAATLTYAAAIGIPIFVSGPIFYLFASKLRENAIMHKKLAEIAAQDSLTTCLNRGAFITLVDAYLSQLNAPEPVNGGFLVIDADHFKSINDQFGHASGDRALQLIAKSMREALRETDLLGRIGGEEFAALLPKADDKQVATIAERIRSRVAQAVLRVEGRQVPLSVSVGGVHFKRPVSFNDLHVAADEQLYSAKRKGRNRVEFTNLARTYA